MKIVLLVSSLGAGGAERVATTLSNAWADRNDQVVLIPTFIGGGVPFYTLDPRIELRYLSDEVSRRKGTNNYIFRLLTLRRMIVSINPDIVISFLPNVNIAGILATALTGIPVIISERSDPMEDPIGKLWTIACRLLYRFADAVIVQTNSVAQRIGFIYPNIKRVAVLPNPLPPEIGRKITRPSSIVQKGERRVLLSVGRLSSEKRPGHIVVAFAQIADLHPEWDLHFVGDGPLQATLQQQIEQCGLSGRISLLGLSYEPWNLMRAADAFVLASAFEGFPNALLEAVALGLPAVSTDCPSGPRDISDCGRVVKLVTPNDDKALATALDELLSNTSLRNQLAREGPESVRRRYGLPVVLESWDVLMNDVISQNSSD